MTLWFDPIMETLREKRDSDIRKKLSIKMIKHLNSHLSLLQGEEVPFVRSLFARARNSRSGVWISVKKFIWIAKLCARTKYEVYDSDLWFEIADSCR